MNADQKTSYPLREYLASIGVRKRASVLFSRENSLKQYGRKIDSRDPSTPRRLTPQRRFAQDDKTDVDF